MNFEIGSVLFVVLQKLIDVNYVVIDLLVEVFQLMFYCCLEDKIKGKMINEISFFCDFFFLSIFKIFVNVRDELVLYVLKCNSKDFDEFIKNYVCILVLLNGNELKCLRQLVNFNKEVFFFFYYDDGMFFFGKESMFLNL